MTKLTKDFYAVRPGKIYPETIPAGTELDGELAAIATSLGIVEMGKPVTTEKPKSTPKNKAQGPAPENKG